MVSNTAPLIAHQKDTANDTFDTLLDRFGTLQVKGIKKVSTQKVLFDVRQESFPMLRSDQSPLNSIDPKASSGAEFSFIDTSIMLGKRTW